MIGLNVKQATGLGILPQRELPHFLPESRGAVLVVRVHGEADFRVFCHENLLKNLLDDLQNLLDPTAL